MKSEKILQITLLTLFGTLGSILVGFIFFSTSIFIPDRSAFQFIMAGFYGSLFFSLLEYKSVREQIFGIIFILILQLVVFTGRHLSVTYIMRDIFYLGSLFLSIKLYHLFLKRNPKIKFYLRSFALALFYGLLSAVLIGIVFLINFDSSFPPIEFIYVVARNAVLIGFGIGLGIDFYLQNRNQLFAFLKIKTI